MAQATLVSWASKPLSPSRAQTKPNQNKMNNNQLGLLCVAIVIDVLTLVGIYVLIGAHFAK